VTSSEKLLDEISKLKARASQREEERNQALALQGKATGQLEALTEKLSTEFGTTDWDEAAQMLEKLRTDAQRAVQDAREAFENV
jgi:DNA-binding ferritin-like protein